MADSDEKRFEVTVRTPSGFSHGFEVEPTEKVEHLTSGAVAHFEKEHQLEAGGRYDLILIDQAHPNGEIVQATEDLKHYQINSRSDLRLRNKGSHVDGGYRCYIR